MWQTNSICLQIQPCVLVSELGLIAGTYLRLGLRHFLLQNVLLIIIFIIWCPEGLIPNFAYQI